MVSLYKKISADYQVELVQINVEKASSTFSQERCVIACNHSMPWNDHDVIIQYGMIGMHRIGVDKLGRT